MDAAGNVYISELASNKIRKVEGGNGSHHDDCRHRCRSNFTGDGGAATSATMNGPAAIAFDPSGNLYFADDFNHRVRKIDTLGMITTVAGNGGTGSTGDGGLATSAALGNFVLGVAVDAAGNVYIESGGCRAQGGRRNRDHFDGCWRRENRASPATAARQRAPNSN